MNQPVRTDPSPADTRGDRTRRAIVAAARERFTTHGYAESTLADVARDAGVSSPTVAFHFGSKTGLLAAVIADYYDGLLAQIDEVIDAPSSPADRLTAFAHFWIGAHEDSFPLFGVFAAHGGWRAADSEIGRTLAENNRRVTRVLERLIDDLKADGTLRDDVGTRLLRDAFFGTCEHLWRGRLVSSRPWNPDRAADELLDLLFHGAVPAPAAVPASVPEATPLAELDRKLDLLLARTDLDPIQGAP
jgi:AcrR family transcriptional regulator